MRFRILGLDPRRFRRYAAMGEAELRRADARRMVADADSDFPCRVTLTDVPAGETALLVHYRHQPAASPYRSSGPIFVWQGAGERYDRIDAVPDSARSRLYALRAYDGEGMMVDAELAEGTALEGMIARSFASSAVAYLHAHHARRGCYAFAVTRV